MLVRDAFHAGMKELAAPTKTATAIEIRAVVTVRFMPCS